MTPETFRYEIDSNGCWIWAGYCDSNGYGRIHDRDRKRIEWAHRYSYMRHVGPIAPRYQIDHMCQVPRCVNPEHLQQLTPRDHARVTMERLGKLDLARKAAHLRRLGMTYAEIADALGYAQAEGAAQAVKRAIREGLVDADEIPKPHRLNESEREEVVLLVALGIPQTVVAELYGMDSSHISRVSRGVSSRAVKSAS